MATMEQMGGFIHLFLLTKRNEMITVEAHLADTSAWRKSDISRKLAISIQFDLCNQDTSQLRTAFVNPNGSTALHWIHLVR
jgi:hypothetical protein